MSSFAYEDFTTGRTTAGTDPRSTMPFQPPLVDIAAAALVAANPSRYGGRRWSELPAGHQDVVRAEAQAVLDVARKPAGPGESKMSLDVPHDSLTQLCGQVAEAIEQVDAEIRGFVFLSRNLENGAVSFGYEWDEDGAGNALGELLGNANAVGRIYGIEFGVQGVEPDDEPDATGVILP